MKARLRSHLAALWFLLLHLRPSLAAEYIALNSTTPHQNTNNCTCYVVDSGPDSSTPQYFQYYRFYDFRSLADRPAQYVKTPNVVDDWKDAPGQDVWDANILNSASWNTDWSIQNWSKDATEDFPTRMVNSPANVYLQQNNDSSDPFTYLTLRTTRSEDFQSAAEIENEQKNLMHVSMRMYARVIGAGGAVAGFFTFYDDTNESDIEILTDDPKDKIRYTNQPSVDKKGNEVATASQAPDKLPAWDDWQMHRIDWLDKNSYWYLNDKQVAANTYSVPRKPSGLVINMWSDGGEWSGNMSVGDSAEFQIQWIEMTFNTSGPVEGPGGGNKKRDGELLDKREGKGCTVVCKVDGVKETGIPEIVSVSSLATHVSLSWGVLTLISLTSIWIGI